MASTRTQAVQIRLTEEERDKLTTLAAQDGVPMTSWIRTRLFSSLVVPRGGDYARPEPKAARRSKLIPEAVRAFYEEAHGPAGAALRDEIALLDSRISQLTDRLATSETAQRWDTLAKILQAAIDNPPDDAIPLIGRLYAIVQAEQDERAAWAELEKLTLSKAKLVDAQTRQETAAANRVTPADLGALAVLIRDTIQHVCSRDQLIAIQQRVFSHPLLAYRAHQTEPATTVEVQAQDPPADDSAPAEQ